MRSESCKRLIVSLVLGAWVIIFFLFWRDAIVFSETGVRSRWYPLWGDWAAHFTQGSAMLHRGLWLSSNPLVYGEPYSYPFLANLISAALVKYLALPFFQAFTWPSFFFCCVAVAALYLFYRELLSSRGIALIALTLFLLNGGMGWLWYLKDLLSDSNLKNVWFFDTEYTLQRDRGVYWANVVTTQLVPQRSFTLGFPLALLILIQFWRMTSPGAGNPGWIRMILLGLLMGVFPLIHTHSFLMIHIILLCWLAPRVYECRFKESRGIIFRWGLFYAAMLLPLYPILATYFPNTIGRSLSGSFIQWYPGWYVNPKANPPEFYREWYGILKFWFLNWGVIVPLALLGWCFSSKRQRTAFAPFILIFLLANLFLFQPFLWDNTKVAVWASLGFSALVANILWLVWKRSGVFYRGVALAVFLLSIFSGALDLGLLLRKSPKFSSQLYSADDLKMVRYIEEHTGPNDQFLTSDVANNSIINLSGRPIMMAFEGWLWTYGLNYWDVKEDVRKIYRGGEGAEKLIDKYKIIYVAFDDHVRAKWGGDEEYFRRRYSLFYGSRAYNIYRVRGEGNGGLEVPG